MQRGEQGADKVLYEAVFVEAVLKGLLELRSIASFHFPYRWGSDNSSLPLLLSAIKASLENIQAASSNQRGARLNVEVALIVIEMCFLLERDKVVFLRVHCVLVQSTLSSPLKR